MVIVSDTSVISGLLKIQHLKLLHQVFSDVIIPTKVREELEALKDFGHDLYELEQANWITIKSPLDGDFVQNLQPGINAGEAEAIALAVELQADFLLIDERKGRSVAEHYGLTVIGLIGILIRAKELKYIDAIKPLLEALIDNKFRISAALYKEALKLVNE